MTPAASAGQHRDTGGHDFDPDDPAGLADPDRKSVV